MPGAPWRIGVVVLGWPPTLPWHWAHERVKTALPAVSRSSSAGSGSGSGLTEADIASERSLTLGEENCVSWKVATSSRKLDGGSSATDAWARSAASAWFCSVSMRASSW